MCRAKTDPYKCCLIDFTKASERPTRDGLLVVLAKAGCPEHFMRITKEFHEGMMAQVNFRGDSSETLPFNNDIKIGCALAPSLFNIFLSAVLDKVYKLDSKGVYIHTWPRADLFNLSQFKAIRACQRVDVCRQHGTNSP